MNKTKDLKGRNCTSGSVIRGYVCEYTFISIGLSYSNEFALPLFFRDQFPQRFVHETDSASRTFFLLNLLCLVFIFSFLFCGFYLNNSQPTYPKEYWKFPFLFPRGLLLLVIMGLFRLKTFSLVYGVSGKRE